MGHAIITKIEPRHVVTITPSNSIVSDMTNISDITPERLDKWKPHVNFALAKLPKGVGACSAVIGEPEEMEIVIKKQECLEDFKINMVQRELIHQETGSRAVAGHTCIPEKALYTLRGAI